MVGGLTVVWIHWPQSQKYGLKVTARGNDGLNQTGIS